MEPPGEPVSRSTQDLLAQSRKSCCFRMRRETSYSTQLWLHQLSKPLRKLGRCSFDLAFPDHGNRPPRVLKLRYLPRISLSVELEFPFPEGRVRLWGRRSADWAAVPEASVNEDGYLSSRVSNIRSSGCLSPIHPVAWITDITQYPTYGQLWLGSPSDVTLHGARCRRRRCWRWWSK